MSYVSGKLGHPKKNPEPRDTDRADDSDRHRQVLRHYRIKTQTEKRDIVYGIGLGGHQWAVEWTTNWLQAVPPPPTNQVLTQRRFLLNIQGTW